VSLYKTESVEESIHFKNHILNDPSPHIYCGKGFVSACQGDPTSNAQELMHYIFEFKSNTSRIRKNIFLRRGLSQDL
jgi:hypothetical protein